MDKLICFYREYEHRFLKLAKFQRILICLSLLLLPIIIYFAHHKIKYPYDGETYYRLGLSHSRSNNEHLAVKYYQKGCDLEELCCMNKIAVFYMTGYIYKENLFRARALFSKIIDRTTTKDYLYHSAKISLEYCNMVEHLEEKEKIKLVSVYMKKQKALYKKYFKKNPYGA